MNTVVLRMSDSDALKSNAKFVLGLHLSRLYNSLNANMRHYEEYAPTTPLTSGTESNVYSIMLRLFPNA